VWGDWKSALMIVKGKTVIAWQRKGFSFVLDMANPPWQAGAPQGAASGSGSDSDAEPQQPTLGRTVHSWRITEVGYRDHRTYGGEISACDIPRRRHKLGGPFLKIM
jgi:hypothetical protein